MRLLSFEAQKCLSCHSCELACAVAHSQSNSLYTAATCGEKVLARLFVLKGSPFGWVVFCRHCLQAPCLEVCPTEAIQRTSSGAVVIKAERCIGCQDCLRACPFGVIQIDGNKAVKCDLCGGDPACVKSCPSGALSFLEPAEESRRKRLWAAKKFLFSARRST